jgi:hypothetical protein
MNNSMEMYKKIRTDALEAVARMSDYVVKHADANHSMNDVAKATEIAEAWSRILIAMDKIIHWRQIG